MSGWWAKITVKSKNQEDRDCEFTYYTPCIHEKRNSDIKDLRSLFVYEEASLKGQGLDNLKIIKIEKIQSNFP